MTHEELIEKCQAAAHAVVKDNYFIDAKMKITTREMTAAIISTILTALQEPTEEMYNTIGPTHYKRVIWQAMLNASPLAGEKRGAE